MMTCNHPANQAKSETLLMTCPDCGAKCSATNIGDDDLCYDGSCPLHVMAGEIPEMQNRDGVEIEVGDWVVGGKGEDRDAGRVVALHADGTATVAWEGSAVTVRDRSAIDCKVFTDRRSALMVAFGEESVARTWGI